MTPYDAAAITLLLIGAGGVAWIVTGLLRAAFKRPKRHATYLPKPRRDSRDWQGDFNRSMKP
jgi:hypothetical protein